MTSRPDIPVVPLRQVAEMLGVSVEAARSALRHYGVRSGYPLAAVEWLAANRPGRGARTDRKETTMATVYDIAAAVGMTASPEKVAAFAGCLAAHDPRTGRIPQPWHGKGMAAVFTQEQAERLIAEWRRAAHDADAGRIEPAIEADAGIDPAAAERRHHAAVAEVRERYRP